MQLIERKNDDVKKESEPFKRKIITGGDYFDNPETSNPSSEINGNLKKNVNSNDIERKTMITYDTNKLPTFEELMTSEEIKKKTLLNFDDSEDI